MSTGEGKLRSVAELSGILKNRGFKKPAFKVVSKELCGAAAVDPVRIETKMWGGTLRDNTKNDCVADCHCPGDMAVRMCEVLARPWVGVCSAPCFKFVLSVDNLFMRSV